MVSLTQAAFAVAAAAAYATTTRRVAVALPDALPLWLAATVAAGIAAHLWVRPAVRTASTPSAYSLFNRGATPLLGAATAADVAAVAGVAGPVYEVDEGGRGGAGTRGGGIGAAHH